MSTLPLITPQSPIADAVREGLTATPRRLPPWLFYDAEGSRLFEEITELPEYYLTRTERDIFNEYAGDILRQAGTPLTLIELGAGTATKTSVLIRALLRMQLRADYYPVDVSPTALAVALHRLNGDFPRLKVNPIVADFSSGLRQLRARPGRKLVLFIGSSIGNYEPYEAGELLRDIRSALAPGDALLLGTDFAKSERILLPAYNDASGVTAGFNKNVLARINREFGADFDLDAFEHVALWNPRASRMEMYLESVRPQAVYIPALAMKLRFRAGERIHTENSYKFTGAMITEMLRAGDFTRQQSWLDRRGWFGVHLARVL